MPFECGVFFGAHRFGAGAQRRKRFLLLDAEPFQYQKTMSDAAALDPRAHSNEPETLMACIRDFLTHALDPKPIGPTRIAALYNVFQRALAAIIAKDALTIADIEPISAFNDWHLLATRWLQQQATPRP